MTRALITGVTGQDVVYLAAQSFVKSSWMQPILTG